MRCRAVAIAACLGAAANCGGSRSASTVVAASPPAAASASAVPHGDHNPHFGGIVLMNGDLHFEVVLGRDGRHRVYFSDAVRAELPAATAAAVTITVTQKGRPPESVNLQIDESGESWAGQGHRIDDPAATARVAYTSHGQPYFIDLPVPH